MRVRRCLSNVSRGKPLVNMSAGWSCPAILYTSTSGDSPAQSSRMMFDASHHPTTFVLGPVMWGTHDVCVHADQVLSQFFIADIFYLFHPRCLPFRRHLCVGGGSAMSEHGSLDIWQSHRETGLSHILPHHRILKSLAVRHPKIVPSICPRYVGIQFCAHEDTCKQIWFCE